MIVLADWLAYTCALLMLAAFALSSRLPASVNVWNGIAASVVVLQVAAVACAALAWFILLVSFALN